MYQKNISVSNIDFTGRSNPELILKMYLSQGYIITYVGKTGYTLEYGTEPTEVHRSIVSQFFGFDVNANKIN